MKIKAVTGVAPTAAPMKIRGSTTNHRKNDVEYL